MESFFRSLKAERVCLRPSHEGRPVIWQVAARRSTYKKLDKRSAQYKAKRKIDKAKAQVRAKVEHPFRVIKRQFHFTKVRFRSLANNTSQLVTLFALSNLWMARRHLLTNAGEVRLQCGNSCCEELAAVKTQQWIDALIVF